MDLRSFLDSFKTRFSSAEKFLVPLILLIVVCAGAWFLFFQSSLNEVVITVHSGGNLVDGVEVRVFDGNALVASGFTVNGKAVFSGLPEKQLTFKFSKTGFSARSATVDVSLEKSFDLSLSSERDYSTSLDLRIVSQGNPLQGVLISFSSVDGEKELYSDEAGLVSLQGLQKGFVRLTLSKQGFKTISVSVVALEGEEVQEIELQKENETPVDDEINAQRNVFSFSQAGAMLTVLIRDESGELLSGSIKLYSVDGTLLDEQVFSDGVAFFQSLTLGSSGFVTVQSNGFLPFSSESDAIIFSEVSTYSVVLTQEGFSDAVVIKTINAEGELVPAKIIIFTQPKTILLETSSEGVLLQELAEGEYYALALADGFLPKVSEAFSSGSIVLTLEEASVLNSALITARVRNEAGTPESSARVDVTENGLLLLPSQSTDSDGVTDFVLRKGASVSFNAIKNNAFASKALIVSIDEEVVLSLELYAAFLELKAFDLVSKSEVAASFKVFVDDELTASCSESCKVKIPGFKALEIETSSEGYLNSLTQLAFVSPGEVIPLSIFITPLSAVSGASVSLVGLYDEKYRPVSSVSPGKEYSVVLVASPANQAASQGIYLRVGSKESVDSDNAGIKYFAEAPLISKSTIFEPGSICVDLSPRYINPNSEGLFKWVELVFDDAKTMQVFYKILVKDSIKETEKLNLFYRSWSSVENAFSRAPEDVELGSDPDSDEKSSCYASTVYSSFDVKTPTPSVNPTATPSVTPTPTATPTATPTPTPVIPPGQDPEIPDSQKCSNYNCRVCSEADCLFLQEAGNYCEPEYAVFPGGVKEFNSCKTGSGVLTDPKDYDAGTLDSGVEIRIGENGLITVPNEIEFVIDSVYPVDAVELNLVEGVSCKALLSVKSNSNSKACFSVSEDKKILSFKSKDAGNVACPVSVSGNGMQGVGSALLEVASTCGEKKTVQLKVTSKAIESISVSPDDLGNGDESAKLFYVVNNKQFGGRDLSIAGSSFDLPKVGVRVFAWNGPGVLNVKDGSSTLASFYYEQKTSYFAKTGELGKQVDSCSSFDCCASGWCTPSALSTALSEFKRVSREWAEKTIFRRGDLKPGVLIGSTKFKFVGVMQVVEGGTQEFSKNGFRVTSSCGSLPGVYEVEASFNGVKWEYKASALSLDTNLKNSANKPLLCGFGCGEGTDVKMYDHGVLCSTEQSSEEHRKYKLVLSYFTGLPPMWIPLVPVSSKTSLCKLSGTTPDFTCVAKISTIFELKPAGVIDFSLSDLLGIRYSGSECMLGVGTDSLTCIPMCKPVKGLVQPLVKGNQLTYVIRFGVKANCDPAIPDLKQFIIGITVGTFYDELGAYYELYQNYQDLNALYDEKIK
ncbi:MAG: hypothetical protein ABH803_01755 [Candidatus Micrarchaeota archaeon]